MLKTNNKKMNKLGGFLTRAPKKDGFTEYIYSFANGDKVVISRSELSKDVDDVLYEELDKENKNNRTEIEEWRSYSKDPVKHEAILDMQETKISLEDSIINTLKNEALIEAVNNLGTYEQELVYKKYYQKKSNTLIADEEGVSEGTIRYRLSMVLEELKKLLKNKI